jgi:hypothetical protein
MDCIFTQNQKTSQFKMGIANMQTINSVFPFLAFGLREGVRGSGAIFTRISTISFSIETSENKLIF